MPSKRRQANAPQEPDGPPPLRDCLDSDEESDLSSEDDSQVVPLDADDSMFRPPVVNRIDPVAPALLTRHANAEHRIPSAPSLTPHEGQARRSTRRTAGRSVGGVQPKGTSHEGCDAVSTPKGGEQGALHEESYSSKDSTAKSAEHNAGKGKPKRPRDASPGADERSQERPDSNTGGDRLDESPTKKRRESDQSSGTGDPPLSRQTFSSEDKKGKRKKQLTPEPDHDGHVVTDDNHMNVEVPPADEIEAEDIRKAMEASLQYASASLHKQLGKSSASTSHSETATPDASATQRSVPAVTSVSRTPAPSTPPGSGAFLLPSTPNGSPPATGLSLPPSTPSSSSVSGTPSPSSVDDTLRSSSPNGPTASPSSVGAQPSASPPPNGTQSPSARRTFAAARLQISGVQSRPIMSSRGGHDANEYRVRELPQRCQVDNGNLQDDMLREFYRNLPNLILGAFISWSQLRGSGQFPFSHWGDVAPTMDFENALTFINFNVNGRYINPSRASPLLTRAVRTTPNGFRMNLYIDNEPAILLSTIYVRQSHLLAPPPRGLRQHLIAGVGHTQEWERQVSFICMVFGQPALRAQLSADVLTYSTRSDTTQNYNSPLGQFSSTQSPTIRVSARSFQTTSDNMALSFNDPVPVYDARTTAVDLSDINSLFTLPRFDGEVPANSFAVVGYTTNAYLSNRDNAWHVSCNIRFVVVVGTPSDPDEGAPVPLDD